MKKTLPLILAAAFRLAGCGNDSNKSENDTQTTKQAQKIERSFDLPNSGAVKITCEYDEAGDEYCSGIYESTGQPVPDDVVRELVEFPIIDENIEKTVQAGCENKILVLTCDLRDEYPNAAFPEPGNPDNAKNKEFNQKKQESRAKAMDAFVKDNPGLLSEQVIQDYKSGGYSFNINLNACDYESFIKKNKYKLYILELHGVVDNTPDPTCANPIDYTILRNDKLSSGKEGSKGEYHIYKDAESWHAFIDSQKTYFNYEGFDFESWSAKYKSLSDNIDFSKYYILAAQFESGTGSAKLNVMKACDNQIEIDMTWCEGKAMTADMAYPLMIIRIPKGDYQVTVGTKGLACDDSHNPLPGMVPTQNEDIQELIENPGTEPDKTCKDAIQYNILEQTNLGGTGDEKDWNKQTAHPINDMKSLTEYLDTLRSRHLGEWTDGKDNSTHYIFDDYTEKYKTFDFKNNMMIALEGGSQPSGGYGMEVAQACDNTIEYNVTWCDDPNIGYTADIGYPFMLISLPKGNYEYKGGTNSHKCK